MWKACARGCEWIDWDSADLFDVVEGERCEDVPDVVKDVKKDTESSETGPLYLRRLTLKRHWWQLASS